MSPPSVASVSTSYQALQMLHLSGVALLIGNLVLLELRVWGWAPELPVAALARRALTVSVIGSGVAVFSGALLFGQHAAELIDNRAFLVKMGLLCLAAANAGLFHARDGLLKLDKIAKAQTALSVLLWLSVVWFGLAIGQGQR